MPFPLPPLPSIGQLVFAGIAIFTCASALGVVLVRNLFHGALALVATLFGVAALYVMLEAEFLAVSQVLVYVGAIATLITFAIMLTRSMMYGKTSPMNRQWGKTGLFVVMLFLALMGFVNSIPWADSAAPVLTDESVIAALGELFVTKYVIAFEVLGLLLLVALVGAVMLARDNN
jgi:NADH:ubiquinone oxidoreductase subunit 6 (subunit J)